MNNAGAIPVGTLADIDEDTWREAWDLKLLGYINMMRAMYAEMKARGRGVIVNKGSSKFRGVKCSRHRRLNEQTPCSTARRPFRTRMAPPLDPRDFCTSELGAWASTLDRHRFDGTVYFERHICTACAGAPLDFCDAVFGYTLDCGHRYDGTVYLKRHDEMHQRLATSSSPAVRHSQLMVAAIAVNR